MKGVERGPKWTYEQGTQQTNQAHENSLAGGNLGVDDFGAWAHWNAQPQEHSNQMIEVVRPRCQDSRLDNEASLHGNGAGFILERQLHAHGLRVLPPVPEGRPRRRLGVYGGL